MSIGFDTLRAAEDLKQAGIADTHAKAIVATMQGAVGENVATKADVADLKTEVAAVRTEVAELKAVLTWRIVLVLGAFTALTRMMP